MVEMVLATDMSCHFQQVKTMKNFLQQPEGSVSPPFTHKKDSVPFKPSVYLQLFIPQEITRNSFQIQRSRITTARSALKYVVKL